MRRLLAWISGAAGGVVAYRLLRRRAAPVAELPAVDTALDPRAEELRAKLEQAAPPEPETGTAPEQEADAAPAAAATAEPAGEEDPDARRRRVHDAGRATVDEMRRPPQS